MHQPTKGRPADPFFEREKCTWYNHPEKYGINHNLSCVLCLKKRREGAGFSFVCARQRAVLHLVDLIWPRGLTRCFSGPTSVNSIDPSCICFFCFGLIIMRIRFRASDFGLVAKVNSLVQYPDFLYGDDARVILFFARVIQPLGFWTQTIQANVDSATSGAVQSALRSALDSSIQAYAQTLVWPRRDVPRRFTWSVFFFNKASEPSTRAAALCVLSHDTYPRKTRAGCTALLVL